MAHIRMPGAEEQDALNFRLEFLVVDNFAMPPMMRSGDLFDSVGTRLAALLQSSPQSAVLYPDGQAVSTVHRGEQPRNGMRVVLHYTPDVINVYGAARFYEFRGFELLMLADSARVIEKDGTVHFLKDRQGWDEREAAPCTVSSRL